MSNFTRKDFLRLTSLGLVAALLPIEEIRAFQSITTKSNTNDDFTRAKLIAAEAKEKFYLKDFATAEGLYLQSIILAPKAISLYDGLDNVYGALQMPLKSIALYKRGLELNPEVPSFYDRTARSLMRLETGNKRVATEYKREISSTSLLNHSANLYRAAMQISGAAYLNIGLNKVLARINIAPLEQDYKVNRVFKNLKNQNRNTYKLAVNQKSDSELFSLIARVDNKKRRELYTLKEIEEREVNKLLQKKKFYDILQKRESLTVNQKIDVIDKLLAIDYTDSNSIKRVRTVYYINNKFIEFVAVRKKFADATKSFYGYIGVMDAMELAYKKRQAGIEILDEAIEIGYGIKESWALVEKAEVDLIIKLSKILLLAGNYAKASSLLQESMRKIKIPTISINNKLITHYAKMYYEQHNYETAKQILLIGTKEVDKETRDKFIKDNPLLEPVAYLSENEVYAEFKDNLTMYYLLYNTYFSLGETEKSVSIIEKLILNNPLDSFVLTRN